MTDLDKHRIERPSINLDNGNLIWSFTKGPNITYQAYKEKDTIVLVRSEFWLVTYYSLTLAELAQLKIIGADFS